MHERGRRPADRRGRLGGARTAGALVIGATSRRVRRRRGPPPLPDLRPGSDRARRRSARSSRPSATSSSAVEPRDAEPARRRRARRHGRARGRQLRVPRADRLRRRGRDRHSRSGTSSPRRSSSPRCKEAFEEQVESGVSLEHETAWIGRNGHLADRRLVAAAARGAEPTSSSSAGPTSPSARRRRPSCAPRARGSSRPRDDARRRLERNLHDGAQQRLVSLSLALRLAQARLARRPRRRRARSSPAPGEELTHALAELRELARGIHPAVLTDRGLAAALEALAARAPLPVELVDRPRRSGCPARSRRPPTTSSPRR